MKNIESFENFNEKKNWIKDAIKKPGSLRSAAKRRGLIKGDETLSKTDLNKLSKVKGKTGKRANLARTLKSMNESISSSELFRDMNSDLLNLLDNVCEKYNIEKDEASDAIASYFSSKHFTA